MRYVALGRVILLYAALVVAVAPLRAGAAPASPIVGLWAVDGAKWNGVRFTAEGTVVEYDRGRATGEFPYSMQSSAVAVVHYGIVNLVYRLAGGMLTTYNRRGILRLHRARAIAQPPRVHPI